MNSLGKENVKNHQVDSLRYKNSVTTNPEELKKFVNVDFENW